MVHFSELYLKSNLKLGAVCYSRCIFQSFMGKVTLNWEQLDFLELYVKSNLKLGAVCCTQYIFRELIVKSNLKIRSTLDRQLK